MTLNFGEDRSLQGSTVCGPFTARFWVRHDAIGLDEASELQKCLPSPWSLFEQDYYHALGTLGRFTVDASQLTLKAADSTLVFEPVGPRCDTPKPISGDAPVDLAAPWSAVNAVLTTDHPIDQLIQRLEAEYPDLVLRSSNQCGVNEVPITVNRVTLQYLRCRSDVSTITYQ